MDIINKIEPSYTHEKLFKKTVNRCMIMSDTFLRLRKIRNLTCPQKRL